MSDDNDTTASSSATPTPTTASSCSSPPPPTATATAAASTGHGPSPSPSSTDLALQQQTLLQQQLQQQQLQLLQLQQQQLQSLSHNLSAPDLSTLQQQQQQQQQLALFMMPMFPLMMPPLAQPLTAPESGAPDAATAGDGLPSDGPAGAESMGLVSSFGSSADGFGLLASTNAMASATGVLNMDDDVPKRKRGRPPKKDAAARAKGDVEKALKQQQQLPFWGYGLPMPLVPGFPPAMLSGMSNPGAVVLKDHTAAAAACEDELLEHAGDAERPSKTAKKKQRGTGKPRGRPRTRPRPGELIRRVKPLPIAPANFSVMYNYSLSSLAHKSAELHGDGSVADADGATAVTDEAQDRSLASLSASLLSSEHE